MGGLALMITAAGLAQSGVTGLPMMICAAIIMVSAFALIYMTADRKWIPIALGAGIMLVIACASAQIGSREVVFAAAGILIALMAASVFLPPRKPANA